MSFLNQFDASLNNFAKIIIFVECQNCFVSRRHFSFSWRIFRCWVKLGRLRACRGLAAIELQVFGCPWRALISFKGSITTGGWQLATGTWHHSWNNWLAWAELIMIGMSSIAIGLEMSRALIVQLLLFLIKLALILVDLYSSHNHQHCIKKVLIVSIKYVVG